MVGSREQASPLMNHKFELNEAMYYSNPTGDAQTARD